MKIIFSALNDVLIYGYMGMWIWLACTYAGSEQRHYSGEHPEDNVSDIQLKRPRWGGVPNAKGFALRRHGG